MTRTGTPRPTWSQPSHSRSLTPRQNSSVIPLTFTLTILSTFVTSLFNSVEVKQVALSTPITDSWLPPRVVTIATPMDGDLLIKRIALRPGDRTLVQPLVHQHLVSLSNGPEHRCPGDWNASGRVSLSLPGSLGGGAPAEGGRQGQSVDNLSTNSSQVREDLSHPRVQSNVDSIPRYCCSPRLCGGHDQGLSGHSLSYSATNTEDNASRTHQGHLPDGGPQGGALHRMEDGIPMGRHLRTTITPSSGIEFPTSCPIPSQHQGSESRCSTFRSHSYKPYKLLQAIATVQVIAPRVQFGYPE